MRRGAVPRSPATDTRTAGGWASVARSMRSYFNGTPSQGRWERPSRRLGAHRGGDGWDDAQALHQRQSRPDDDGERAARLRRETSAIGSDPDWDYRPRERIDDLRIWKRRADAGPDPPDDVHQLFAGGERVAAFPGLEAWYAFEGNANDSWHTHHGTITGTGLGFEQGATFTTPNQVLKLPGYPQHGLHRDPGGHRTRHAADDGRGVGLRS